MIDWDLFSVLMFKASIALVDDFSCFELFLIRITSQVKIKVRLGVW